MPAMLYSSHFWQQEKHWKNILMKKIMGEEQKRTLIQTLRQSTKDLLTAETLIFNSIHCGIETFCLHFLKPKRKQIRILEDEA